MKTRFIEILIILCLTFSLNSKAQALISNSYITTYSDYLFKSGTFYNKDIQLTVDVDPGIGANQFFSHLFYLENSTGYIGLQAGETQKIAIFSIWDATSATSGASGSYCLPFGGEGVGQSCRIPYNWKSGNPYRLRIWAFDRNSWGGWVKDLNTGTETFLGTIKTPTSMGWLTGGSTTFVEYFGPDFASCDDLKVSRVKWEYPSANDGSINSSWLSNSTGPGACGNIRSSVGENPSVHTIGSLSTPAQMNKLNVTSVGASGVAITNSNGYGGIANYSITVPGDTYIELTAPTNSSGASFTYWSGCDSTSGANGETCKVKVETKIINICIAYPCLQPPSEETVTATYLPSSKLNVTSSGASSVPISSNTGQGGSTNYSIYNLSGGTSVVLTAPLNSGGKTFLSWSGCDSTSGTSSNVCTSTMPYCKACPTGQICTAQCQPDWEKTLTANYQESITQDCLLNWAEDKYPTLFTPSRPTNQTFGDYTLRYYTQTGSYLVLSSDANGHLYYYAPNASSNAMLDLGLVSTWKATAGCTQ